MNENKIKPSSLPSQGVPANQSVNLDASTEQPDNHHIENLWEVLTILRMSNKTMKGTSKRGNKNKWGYKNFLERQSIVKKLLSYKKETLECAKVEVERQIEDGRIVVPILAGFGVVLGYFVTGTWVQLFILAYFTLLGIFIYIEVSKAYLALSLLKQALVLNHSCSVNSKE